LSYTLACLRESAVIRYPECWTTDQWQTFKKENDRLVADNGCLGCTACAQVRSLRPDEVSTGLRLQLSKEWTSNKIQPYGDTREKMLMSLRKKIHKHAESQSHKSAIRVNQKAAMNTLQQTVIENQKVHIDTTARVFCTVYHIAKQNLPFVDHPELVNLQQLNGVDMGRVLHSNVVATDICDFLYTEMCKKLIESVIAAGLPISVLIDESTSLGQKSCLIVYLRCSVDAACGPLTVFLDLVELNDLGADSIVEALINCLFSHGLTHDFLSDHWLGLATDSASVMLGHKAGVYAKLKTKYPSLIGWHCMNHRLELAVHDAVKSCVELNHFKIFMDKLYTLYSTSPKNRRLLEKCAAEIGG
jgi:hypothetical protein